MLRRRGLAFGRLGRSLWGRLGRGLWGRLRWGLGGRLGQPRCLDELHSLGHDLVVQTAPGRVDDQCCDTFELHNVVQIDAVVGVGTVQCLFVGGVHVLVPDASFLVPCGPVVAWEAVLSVPLLPHLPDDLRQVRVVGELACVDGFDTQNPRRLASREPARGQNQVQAHRHSHRHRHRQRHGVGHLGELGGKEVRGVRGVCVVQPKTKESTWYAGVTRCHKESPGVTKGGGVQVVQVVQVECRWGRLGTTHRFCECSIRHCNNLSM